MPPTSTRNGVAAGIGAYFFWGLMPLYLKLFGGMSALDVLAQRVIWSFVLLAFVAALIGGGARLRAALAQPKLLLVLTASTLMIAANWLAYTWAVLNGHVLDTSLGYFMLPLLNVLLGVLLLGERFDRSRQLAAALALAGVVIQTVALGKLPWVSVVVAISFALYGYLRKRAAVDAVTGLLIETALLAPIGLVWLTFGAGGIFGRGMETDLLLMALGIVTTVPLALFGFAARRLTLSTIGFLQYIAPSIGFGLAVFSFGEALDPWKLVSFGFIWVGIAVYSLGGLQRRNNLAKR